MKARTAEETDALIERMMPTIMEDARLYKHGRGVLEVLDGFVEDYACGSLKRSVVLVHGFNTSRVSARFTAPSFYTKADLGGKTHEEWARDRARDLLRSTTFGGRAKWWIDPRAFGEDDTKLFNDDEPLIAVTRPDLQGEADVVLEREGFKIVFDFEGNATAHLRMWMRTPSSGQFVKDIGIAPDKSNKKRYFNFEGFHSCCGARWVTQELKAHSGWGVYEREVYDITSYKHLLVAERSIDDAENVPYLLARGLRPWMTWKHPQTGEDRVLLCGFPHNRRWLTPA